jgi:hypothetical protein
MDIVVANVAIAPPIIRFRRFGSRERFPDSVVMFPIPKKDRRTKNWITYRPHRQNIHEAAINPVKRCKTALAFSESKAMKLRDVLHRLTHAVCVIP